ncbi:MAG: Pycsar system effector family protein [Actinomycetota bacterium]
MDERSGERAPVDPIAGRQTVDHVLRTVQQNTLQLSAMADQKASVVLGAAFVMATIVFGDLTGLEDSNVETVLLAVTAVLSGVLAAFAVMPRIMVGGQRSERPNLLFFGAVATLERDDYIARMRALLQDDDAIYEAVLEDIHQGSQVLLERKYRLLKLSYLALIVGMISTLIAVLVT